MASHGVNHLCTRFHCHQPTQNYLCENCTTQLANMLDQLPWLLDELDARIQRLARTNQGTIGRTSRPNELNIIDFDAAETARKVRKLLLHWVQEVVEQATGRRPPALHTAAAQDLAKWLCANTNHIALLPCAPSLYTDIEKLANTDNNHRGELIIAINPQERHFAGPCPTTTGHTTTGEPIECETPLYADTDETTVTCPTCNQKIDVEKNRLKAAVDRDLLPEPKLLEVMDNLGERISRVKLYQWIREQRIRPKGWIHDGKISNYRIRRGDPAVYSLKRARKLRLREQRRQESSA